MNALEARALRSVLVVAMANKLERIAWAVLSSGEDYRTARPQKGGGWNPTNCQ